MPRRITKEDSADIKMRFGIWLGLPPTSREPRTQEAFASSLGVHPETLTKWRKDPEVQRAKANALKLFWSKDISDVMQAIVKDAKDGKPASQRLFAEMMGLLEPAQKKGQSGPIDVIVKYKVDGEG